MEHPELIAALAEAYRNIDSGGRSKFPKLSQPVVVDGYEIPEGAVVHFPPTTLGVYHIPGRAPERQANNAVIFVDPPTGSCIKVSPTVKQVGIKIVCKLRIRNRPKSLQTASD